MIKNIRILLVICIIAIAGVIVLQFYWIRNYYQISLINFEKEANIAFEDALKKDFQLRSDTIEQLLIEQLMDTNAYFIKSKYLPNKKTIQHNIINAKDERDYHSFSSPKVPFILKVGDTASKRKIAEVYAKTLRTEDLENRVIHYRIQSLGDFELDKVKLYGFDTSHFRSILQRYFERRNIYTAFRFYVGDADSLLNHTELPKSLMQNKLIITSAKPTYKWWATNEQYVRVIFENSISYIFIKMKWIFLGSILLVILVAICIWLLLKALFHEKKLTAIKNDFINNITHELKTPVATISAAVEAMQELNLDKDRQFRYLTHTKNETNRMVKLIDNILNISMHEKNKIVIESRPTQVQESIQEIIESLKIATDKTIDYRYTNTTNINIIAVDKGAFKIVADIFALLRPHPQPLSQGRGE